MSYKPKHSGNDTQREYKPLPIPDAGSQEARISLIVSVGEQKQEGYISKETQKYVEPKREYVEEILVFADVVDCIRDYGEPIGEAQYRQLLNGTWDKSIKGAKFEWAIARDKDGNEIPGKPKTFHPRSLLRELANVTNTHILGYDAEGNLDPDSNMDIEQLLDKPLMIDIKVTKNPDKNGKKDSKGDVIVYQNVKIENFSAVPNKLLAQVAPLRIPAILITLDNVTEETAKFLRKDVIRKILQAKDYPGSKMEEVLSKLKLNSPQPTAAKEETKVETSTLEVGSDSVSVTVESTAGPDIEGFDSDLPF